jgi:hypothetical protein
MNSRSDREDVRTVLTPHLARLMANRLVQKLISQRANLLATQQRAAREVAALEERLAKIQTPLQVQLKAYRQRVLELERELAAKNQKNRAPTQPARPVTDQAE